MTGDELHHLALALLSDFDAARSGRLPVQPVRMTAEEAYELQTEITRLRVQRGEKVIGYKIGCTSKVIQDQLRVDGPIFGRLFDTGCYRSGVRLSHGAYANLAVEGELAIRLSRDLPDTCLGEDECWQAIGQVFPVIELHHYVMDGAGSPGPELIARNAMHAGFVLAEQSFPFGRGTVAPTLSIHIGGIRVETVDDIGLIAGVRQRLPWLAQRLAGCGLSLCAGQTILTGSPMPLLPVGPGCKIVVEAPPLGKSCAEIGP